jgi:hypothetical protein
MSDVAASVVEMPCGFRCLCAASLATGKALYSNVSGHAAAVDSKQHSEKIIRSLDHIRPSRRRRLSGPAFTVGTISRGLVAVLVSLLSVLLDAAPAQVGLPVMQPSRPVVCLGSPVACLGVLLLFPLYVSVGSLLELRRAAHVLGRISVRRIRAAHCIAVLVHVPRPCLSFLNLLGGVASPVTGLTRPVACLGHPPDAPLGSLVVVASARWNRHTDQHRSTAYTTRRARRGRWPFPWLASTLALPSPRRLPAWCGLRADRRSADTVSLGIADHRPVSPAESWSRRSVVASVCPLLPWRNGTPMARGPGPRLRGKGTALQRRPRVGGSGGRGAEGVGFETTETRNASPGSRPDAARRCSAEIRAAGRRYSRPGRIPVFSPDSLAGLPNRPGARAGVRSEALGGGAGGSVAVYPPICARLFRWGADAVDVGLEVVTVQVVVGGNWRRHVMTHTRRRGTAPLSSLSRSTACSDE